MQRFCIQFLAVLLSTLTVSSFAPAASCGDLPVDPFEAVRGYWATEGYGAIVLLDNCPTSPQLLCGSLEWLWEPEGDSASYLGEQIFRGASFENGRWRNGRMLNPEDGREYRGEIEQKDMDLLALKGCALKIICREQQWRRLESLPHSCDSRESGSFNLHAKTRNTRTTDAT